MRALSWSCGVWECSSISSYLERIPSMTPRFESFLNRIIFLWLLTMTWFVQDTIRAELHPPHNDVSPKCWELIQVHTPKFLNSYYVTWILCSGSSGEEPWSPGLSLAPQRTRVDIARGKTILHNFELWMRPHEVLDQVDASQYQLYDVIPCSESELRPPTHYR